MLKGVDKTVQSVKELEGLDQVADKQLQKSDGPEGEQEAAGRVIAYGARALIEEGFRDGQKRRLLRESRQRRT